MADESPETSGSAMAAAVQAAHGRYADLASGEVATYIPELAKADPGLFGVAVCDLEGGLHTAGDTDHLFTIQSISKPFVYAHVLANRGLDAVMSRIDVEPTGDAFNSIIRLESATNRPHNPMVNSGAIAAAGLVAGEDGRERLEKLLALFAGLCAREPLHVDTPVYLSERTTGHRNRAIAHLMCHFGMLEPRINEILDLYFQQCSLLVSARDLAVMAATLANDGINPVDGCRVLPANLVGAVLTVMFTCGLYDHAGRFAFEVGIPAKSGVAGGILAVVPGRMGVGVFSPPLDAKGTSVRGNAVLRDLSRDLHLHVLDPVEPGRPQESTAPEPRALEAAMARARSVACKETSGTVAAYIPELADADPSLLGLSVCGVDGHEIAMGAANEPFTIQSAANPFVYGLALESHPLETVLSKVGVEPSGNPFNAIHLNTQFNRPFNPMGNAGAIVVSSLVPGDDATARLACVLEKLSAYAGVDRLHVDLPVSLSELRHGQRNRAIACLLRNFGLVENEEAALELYLQQCSVAVTCSQLARMGATLANGGVNPVTGVRVLPTELVHYVLTVMYTCGLYDAAGQFAFHVGMPAKSGISGGIVAVAPGRMGLAVFSPPVDSHGNSVRGSLALRELSKKLQLGIFEPPA